MTKLRLKYVQAFGGYYYFRRAGYPRIRLPGVVGSVEFMEAYQRALGSTPMSVGVSRSKPGSVAAAVASYYASSAFRNLAPPTQAARRSALESFRRQHGDKPIGTMPKNSLRPCLTQ
jgi:hypothetical protein